MRLYMYYENKYFLILKKDVINKVPNLEIRIYVICLKIFFFIIMLFIIKTNHSFCVYFVLLSRYIN